MDENRNKVNETIKKILFHSRRLNLYTNELNINLKPDYKRIEKELSGLKALICSAQELIPKESEQQRLEI